MKWNASVPISSSAACNGAEIIICIYINMMESFGYDRYASSNVEMSDFLLKGRENDMIYIARRKNFLARRQIQAAVK